MPRRNGEPKPNLFEGTSFFYLRDSHNFPVTCVAYQLEDKVQAHFAFSTYNLRNEPRPYNKQVAKAKAAGRLLSFRYRYTIPIGHDMNFEEIQHDICLKIVENKGYMAIESPATPQSDEVSKFSALAVEAAKIWLFDYEARHAQVRVDDEADEDLDTTLSTDPQPDPDIGDTISHAVARPIGEFAETNVGLNKDYLEEPFVSMEAKDEAERDAMMVRLFGPEEHSNEAASRP